MVVVAIIALVVIAVAAIVVAVIAMNQGIGSNDMAPLGLDKFQITQCNEGECIPLCFGVNKISSNILWFGNLASVEQRGDSGGGKGGGGSDAPITGYQYFMDIWMGLCMGPGVSVIGAYSQDKSIGLPGLGTYYVNDGSGSYYPTEPGALANKLPGVAHIFLDHFDIGVNTSFVPNINFIVQRLSSAPLTHANLVSGVNPAAIIYDLLVMAGVPILDIDATTSFQAAANYWYLQNYGLNVIFNSQAALDEQIARLLAYVDFSLYQDNTGKWILKAYTNVDASVGTINTEDVRDFTFIRKTWDDTSNDFRATFVDELMDYTQRVITIDNVASINEIGHRIQKSIDLTGFRDKDVACARLAELMKVYSYPSSQIQCSVPYRFIVLNIGEIVLINNTDYNISNAKYRLISVDETDDNNYVKLTLNEMLEDKFDTTYPTGGGGSWVPPDTTPHSPAQVMLVELPYTQTWGTIPTFICLCHRSGIETGFGVYKSPSFEFIANKTTFSTYTLLVDDYLKTTNTIDDEQGLIVMPNPTFDPVWTSIARTDLFRTTRVLIVGSDNVHHEIMTFQNIAPAGVGYPVGSYKLTGVMRGVLGTEVRDHLAGHFCWITQLADNVIQGLGAGLADYKFVPYIGNVSADIGPCPIVASNMMLRAIAPLSVARIKAVRTGTSVAVLVSPSLYKTNLYQNSAGTQDPTQQTDSLTYPDVWGNVWYKITLGGTWTDATSSDERNFTYTQAGSHRLYIRYNWNGVITNNEALGYQDMSLVIGAGDGTYLGPDETSGL